MNVSLYQAASALNANNRWQEVIGENLASAATIGFKRQDVSFASVAAGLIPSSTPGSASQYALTRADNATNFTTGELNVTGQPFDLALESAGFFEIQMPSGTLAYTRNGSFQLNAQGELVTKAGYPVMGENGIIQLDPRSPEPFVIDQNGDIRRGGEILGKIKIVDFNDPGLLANASGSYFLATHPGLQSFEVANPIVRQGFLEASNASAVNEMANLIMAMRNYEANQKVIQAHDERMSRAIQELSIT